MRRFWTSCRFTSTFWAMSTNATRSRPVTANRPSTFCEFTSRLRFEGFERR